MNIERLVDYIHMVSIGVTLVMLALALALYFN